MRNKILLFAFLGVLLILSSVPSLSKDAPASETLKICLEDAIELTLKNNLELKLWEKNIGARELDQDKAEFYSEKLSDADEKIADGYRELAKQKAEFEMGKAAGVITDPDQIAAIEKQLAAAEAELDSVKDYRVDTLEEAQVIELYQTKADLGLSVTKLGYEVARKNYALLARQKYYEVLKAQKLVKVKESAAKRAESQYKMAHDSYEAGFRAKDDMLMAQAQKDLMHADLVKVQNDLKQAEIALKKVMNMDVTKEIKLVDDFTTDYKVTNIQKGLTKALQNRVEIKKAEMELTVAQINMELVKRYLTPNTFSYRQMEMELENAELEMARQKQEMETGVYQSYNNVIATKSMLDYVQNSVKEAQEAVGIATYRYQEGYGMPSSVLKSLNMEDAGGTIFEVLAAEEKLNEIEEKVVNIIYSYNLAKSKYEVDICQ